MRALKRSTLPTIRFTTLALALCAPLAAQAQGEARDLTLAEQARRAASDGRLGQGVRLMDEHLAAHPDDRAARLDRARFLAWRGDYAAAIATLDALGVDDAEAQAVRARTLALAGRQDAALAANAPLYTADPQNYDHAWTQALILRQREWPHQALEPLATVIAAKPDSTDTRDLARAVRLPMLSSIGFAPSWYDDDDDIRIDTYAIDANFRVSEQWWLTAQALQREYSAPITSPFAPATGGTSIDEKRVSVGARVALSPRSAAGLTVARSELDPGDSATLGRIEFQHRASDAFEFTLRGERERIGTSPRATSLNVIRNGGAIDATWRPTLRDRLGFNIAYEHYNDGNRRRWVLGDWRHAVIRGDRAYFDLGLQVEHIAFSKNPGNGYYSPDRYSRIAPVASTYTGIGKDAGLYLQAVIGAQRDETFDSWKRAIDVGGELTVGIYSRWQLVGRAGYSERLNEFGQYEGASVGLELRYRFCVRRHECPAAAE